MARAAAGRLGPGAGSESGSEVTGGGRGPPEGDGKEGGVFLEQRERPEKLVLQTVTSKVGPQQDLEGG